jgi:hypothetical protein
MSACSVPVDHLEAATGGAVQTHVLAHQFIRFYGCDFEGERTGLLRAPRLGEARTHSRESEYLAAPEQQSSRQLLIASDGLPEE